MANRLVLLTGSNLGNKQQMLYNCLAEVERSIGSIVSTSPVLESVAWGFEGQANFLNQAIEVHTAHSVFECHKRCIAIENQFGRSHLLPWGPRTLDIDLIYFNTDIVLTEELIIPHKELSQRRFALKAVDYLDPYYIDPLSKCSVRTMLLECEDESEVIELL